MSPKDQSVSRRDFGKKVAAGVAGVAAAAVVPGVAKGAGGCPITYDENGDRKFWACIVDVDTKIGNDWYYVYEECYPPYSQFTVLERPGLANGHCSKPREPECIDRDEVDACERVEVDGRVLLIPQGQDKERLVNVYRSAKRSE